MADPAVVDYVKKQLMAGVPLETIRTNLMEEDWSDKEIDDAVNVAQNEIHLSAVTQKKFGKKEKAVDAMGAPFEQQPTKPVIGIILSLVAGLLILTNLLTELGMSQITVMQDSMTQLFATIGIVDFTFSLFNIVLGVIIIIGALLIHKEKHRTGGVIVLALSAFYFLLNGFNIAFLLGIVGGIFGIIKK